MNKIIIGITGLIIVVAAIAFYISSNRPDTVQPQLPSTEQSTSSAAVMDSADHTNPQPAMPEHATTSAPVANPTPTPAPKPVTTKPPVSAAKKITVHVADYAFAPAMVTIHAGDTIVWINGDSASHTITSDSGSELASDYIKNGESFSHVFKTPGTYSYHCMPHPWMKGQVIVQ